MIIKEKDKGYGVFSCGMEFDLNTEEMLEKKQRIR
jgi:hypothetical protein|tara:strand:- start:356 stop:460 length:105 start_codon:yes stop_codon:yes gene_type:complete